VRKRSLRGPKWRYKNNIKMEYAVSEVYRRAVVNTVIGRRENPGRNKILGRSRCRWKDHIKMDIRKWNSRRVRTIDALL
jgi:hypothetical protein